MTTPKGLGGAPSTVVALGLEYGSQVGAALVIVLWFLVELPKLFPTEIVRVVFALTAVSFGLRSRHESEPEVRAPHSQGNEVRPPLPPRTCDEIRAPPTPGPPVPPRSLCDEGPVPPARACDEYPEPPVDGPPLVRRSLFEDDPASPSRACDDDEYPEPPADGPPVLRRTIFEEVEPWTSDTSLDPPTPDVLRRTFYEEVNAWTSDDDLDSPAPLTPVQRRSFSRDVEPWTSPEPPTPEPLVLPRHFYEQVDEDEDSWTSDDGPDPPTPEPLVPSEGLANPVPSESQSHVTPPALDDAAAAVIVKRKSIHGFLGKQVGKLVRNNSREVKAPKSKLGLAAEAGSPGNKAHTSPRPSSPHLDGLPRRASSDTLPLLPPSSKLKKRHSVPDYLPPLPTEPFKAKVLGGVVAAPPPAPPPVEVCKLARPTLLPPPPPPPDDESPPPVDESPSTDDKKPSSECAGPTPTSPQETSESKKWTFMGGGA